MYIYTYTIYTCIIKMIFSPVYRRVERRGCSVYVRVAWKKIYRIVLNAFAKGSRATTSFLALALISHHHQHQPPLISPLITITDPGIATATVMPQQLSEDRTVQLALWRECIYIWRIRLPVSLTLLRAPSRPNLEIRVRPRFRGDGRC